MARAFRRRTFGRRRGSRTPAGAFAGGRFRDGRSIDWEQICGEFCYDTWNNVFPNAVADPIPLCDEQPFSLQRRTLLPLNVLTSQYTIERIVGYFELAWAMGLIDLTLIDELKVLPVATGIQLIPRTSLTTAAGSVLSPRDAADLESNRWMWLDYATPIRPWPEKVLGAAADDKIVIYRKDIDIRTRRRIDGANWQLDAVSIANSAFNKVVSGTDQLLRCNFVLRALLRSYEGR